MMVEDQLDRDTGRIGYIEQLEELDELSTAVAVSDDGIGLPVSRSFPANKRACHGVYTHGHARRSQS
jgi:hypothetical protein